MTRSSHGSSFADALNRAGRISPAVERASARASGTAVGKAGRVTEVEAVWAEIAAEQGAVVERVAAVAASAADPVPVAAPSKGSIAAAVQRAARASVEARAEAALVGAEAVVAAVAAEVAVVAAEVGVDGADKQVSGVRFRANQDFAEWNVRRME